MPSLVIERRNCINGLWGIPDSDETASEWVSLYYAVVYHLSQAGYSQADLGKVSRTGSIIFQADDPREKGGQGVKGSLTMAW